MALGPRVSPNVVRTSDEPQPTTTLRQTPGKFPNVRPRRSGGRRRKSCRERLRRGSRGVDRQGSRGRSRRRPFGGRSWARTTAAAARRTGRYDRASTMKDKRPPFEVAKADDAIYV